MPVAKEVRYAPKLAMNPIQVVLVVLLVAAIGAAVTFFRRMTALEETVRTEGHTVEEKRKELSAAKIEAAEHKEQLEQLKKQLQETKNKLADKKKSQAANSQGGGSKKQKAAEDSSQEMSAASVVHVTDQELETQHRAVRERLEAQVAEAKAEVERLKRAEERRRAETERATQAIMKDQAPAAEVASAARTPEEQVAALKAQLEAFQLAANEREKSLRRELKRAEAGASSAHRRANGNQALYQVIKGQLEIAEDRLALYRRKYEGAKKPESLKAKNGERDTHDVEAQAVVAEVEAPVPPALPPAEG